METQRCGHCREEKELSEYAPSYRGRPGTWCRACNRARYTPKPRPPRPEVPEGHAHCSRCDTVKPLAEFYGLRVKNWCKQCYSEWHRERYTPKGGANDAPRDCAWCGTSYRPKQRRASIYCSRACLSKAREASPERRDQILRSRYGISAAEYDQRLEAQGGGCAICGNAADQTRYGKYLHVDHNHATGEVRGLLCDRCNLSIGQFGDDPALLRAAADYLEAHR